ncbi:hypothetical protein JMA_42470 (plasmid) [Jeotgalibacillus malaysiensis]|uniref:Uncharacterized protein n=1 Tax=Jeotgalibacillus malaysiensis TaxID=1508404 RepID=A0A0B5B043_9BACL|nr:hypothetical protein [Jeotgalibacillus malaysiensis]AJD93564.1 hypothetical protein JMA_42470 [Jeotgalibacillus malaysiensis]
MPTIKQKQVTIVSVEYDLNVVQIGERVLIQHDKQNQHDKHALKVVREINKTDIGFVAASPHTIKNGCVSNSDILRNIPSDTIPLIGKVVRKAEVNYRNGDIVTVLIVEVNVVEPDVKAG